MAELQPLRLRVPEVLKGQLELIAEDLGCSVNAWAIQALAKAARNHVPLEEFIHQPPTRGSGRNRRDVGSGLSAFSGVAVDKFGWPNSLSNPNSLGEIKRAMKEGKPRLQSFMQRMWDAAGLGEYTEEHLGETVRAIFAEP